MGDEIPPKLLAKKLRQNMKCTSLLAHEYFYKVSLKLDFQLMRNNVDKKSQGRTKGLTDRRTQRQTSLLLYTHKHSFRGYNKSELTLQFRDL